ncbi:MAG: type II toxin-antitoxin system RatA family toxin [Proteobacteria bacterium]|nr:type II toxin-antitoxin system RatA family toxin [Pseudomonadota bacterium]
MTIIHKSARVPFSAQQMFDLVNDVASYPHFLPWCSRTHIAEQSAHHMEASMHISKGPLSKAFTTINRLTPYERIDMHLKKGPFKQLKGIWQFETLENGSKVSFQLTFEFNNPVLAFTAGPIFNQVANSLVEAFTLRAHEIYANRTPA